MCELILRRVSSSTWPCIYRANVQESGHGVCGLRSSADSNFRPASSIFSKASCLLGIRFSSSATAHLPPMEHVLTRDPILLQLGSELGAVLLEQSAHLLFVLPKISQISQRGILLPQFLAMSCFPRPSSALYVHWLDVLRRDYAEWLR